MSKFKVGDRVIQTVFPNCPAEGVVTSTDITGDGYGVMVRLVDDYVLCFMEDGRFLPEQEPTLFLKDKPGPQVTPSEGLRLNSGKLRWRNFPMFLMEPLIEVGSHNEIREGNPSGKYETFNFLKGMKVNDCLDSCKRHLKSAESPFESDIDPESGAHHLAAVAWNALVALHNIKTRPDLDDRYKIQK